VLALLLAMTIDGNAALRHASALAALGPHPWGSTRNEAAAQYVAAQMRAVGLPEVELQRFERHGVQGTNVIGRLRAPGEEFVVIGAHHDTVPGSPGAYDDGGGVGVLLVVAEVLAAERSRNRTIVFASFDGEEAEVAGKGQTAGSRAFIEQLGPGARALVGAFAIEMSGWSSGRPVLHPIAYADPRERGRSVIAPGWLVRAALSGSRAAGQGFGVGDPYLSWVYQPAVRSFRVRLYGDDLSFTQKGLPALFSSDSSFSSFYPDYHRPSDVAERLDPQALGAMARAVLGAARALERVPRGPAEQPHWFAAFGAVADWPWLLGVGAASVLPLLWAGFRAGALPFALRLLHSLGFLTLLWAHPVPALWVFLLPNLLLPCARRWWSFVLALAPALGLCAMGAAGWWRGAVDGLWIESGQLAVAGLTLLAGLAWFGTPPLLRAAGDERPRRRGRKAAGLPKQRR
jgi:hypothetical protein